MCGGVTDPRLTDGEGDYLLPPIDDDHVGEDVE